MKISLFLFLSLVIFSFSACNQLRAVDNTIANVDLYSGSVNFKIDKSNKIFMHKITLQRSEHDRVVSLDTNMSNPEYNLLDVNTNVRIPRAMARIFMDLYIPNVFFWKEDNGKIDIVEFHLIFQSKVIAVQRFEFNYSTIRSFSFRGNIFNVLPGSNKIKVKVVPITTSKSKVSFSCTNDLKDNSNEISTRCNSINLSNVSGYVMIVGEPVK